MIQDFEIVNYYISPVDSKSSINFWRLVIDPDGISKIQKRNIQGRTSIHIKSPFNNIEKTRNLITRTSIHIKTPFSDSNKKNEKYEQIIDFTNQIVDSRNEKKNINDDNEEEEDEFLGGLNMNKKYLGKINLQRKNKIEIRNQIQNQKQILSPIGNDPMKIPIALTPISPLDEQDCTTSNNSTPTPKLSTPISLDEGDGISPPINKIKEDDRKRGISDEEEYENDVRITSPHFKDESEFHQYFNENVKVVESDNRRKFSIHTGIKIKLVDTEIDFDDISPSSNRDTNKSLYSSNRNGSDNLSQFEQCLSDDEVEDEEEDKIVKKNRSFSNIFGVGKDVGNKKILKEKTQSISNIFLHMNKKKKENRKKKEILEFNYLDIYENERYFQFFKLYLASEYSLENALFLESVDDYIEELNQQKRKEICKIIIDEFFEENSLKEINISNNVKNRIRKEFENERFSDNLFEKIVLELKNGIMQDSFSRFILSPYFEDMISKKK